jgi:hypothetical protein
MIPKPEGTVISTRLPLDLQYKRRDCGFTLTGSPSFHTVDPPYLQGATGVLLTISDVRYDFIGLNEMNNSIVVREEWYGGRRIVVTGLLKRSPDLDSDCRIAVMRPFSVCCAADALMVGMLAEGEGDLTLTDQWVNVYGTVKRLDAPLTPPRSHHGAIRYAAVSNFVGSHILVSRLMDHQLRGFDSAKTVIGSHVEITLVNGALRAGESRFLFKNTDASNGLIHATFPAIITTFPSSIMGY